MQESPDSYIPLHSGVSGSFDLSRQGDYFSLESDGKLKVSFSGS